MSCRPDVERTQTGVRIEKRLLKVCKAMAELYDLSLAEFFEDLVRDAFAGRQPLSGAALAQALRSWRASTAWTPLPPRRMPPKLEPRPRLAPLTKPMRY